MDLEAGTLRLEPGTTKNDEGRTVYLTPDLKAALAGQVARVEALQKRLGRIIPWLFPRRTAVRNMVNAGVPERVAMQVTGHRTRSVFDRYHIVSPADLQDVARRMTGTIPGTTG